MEILGIDFGGSDERIAAPEDFKHTLMAQLVELQEENARLREDAERYRWLRNKALCIEQVGSFSPYVVKGQVMRAIDDKELDAEIDAARKEQK